MAHMVGGSRWSTLQAGGAVIAGLVVGLLAGFGFGAWTLCDSEGGCRWSTPLFEAIGTWFGAIGTIGALGFAGYQIRGDLRLRRLAEDEARQRRLADARRVRIVVPAYSDNAGSGTVGSLVVRASNGCRPPRGPAYDLQLRLPGIATHFGLGDAAPNQASAHSASVDLASAGLAPRAVSADEQREAVEAIREQMVLTFEQNGCLWRRVGSQEPRLVHNLETSFE